MTFDEGPAASGGRGGHKSRVPVIVDLGVEAIKLRPLQLTPVLPHLLLPGIIAGWALKWNKSPEYRGQHLSLISFRQIRDNAPCIILSKT